MKTIYLSGTVGYEITADSIRDQVDFSSREKIRIIVNSMGGYVADAFEIYNLLQTYRGEIEVVIMGVAASAMSYIIMAADKISAFKNSIFMAHRVQGVALGDSDDMMREASIMSSMDSVIAEAYTSRMKQTKQDILAMMKTEIWLVGWEALVNAGIIDNVIDKPDEIEIPDIEDSEQIVFLLGDNFDIDAEIIKARIALKNMQSRMRRDEDKTRSSMEKMAAIMKNDYQTPSNGPAKIDKIKSEENSMTLTEFLKANPEAMAEYENSLQAARAEGIEVGRAESLDGDRIRINQILELAHVELSESAIIALSEGIEPGEFAKAELLKQKDKREQVKPRIFGNLAIKQTPRDQAPDFDVAKYDDESKNMAKKFFGGGQ